MNLYPLRFEPLFQTYLWGGRRLGTELNKPIGSEPTYAESWEIVDHGEFQSLVQSGEYAGLPLGKLVRDWGAALLGSRNLAAIEDPSRPANLIGRFPLLFKFLDAKQNLSVQVHPDDRLGATLDPPDLGKTEAWYVLDALPGSRIYAGLRSGVSRDEFQQAIESSSAESVLHSFEAHPGDCVFIPAGTVHALGAGLLIAEIQQCSNTTFRLYDWGRLDKDGRPRELHIDQGLEATDFERGPVHPQTPRTIDANTETLVECDKFTLQRIRLSESQLFATHGSFKILVVTAGSVTLADDPCESPLQRGDTCLIPAGMESYRILANGSAELLCVSSDGVTA